jgi:hypothetical protein
MDLPPDKLKIVKMLPDEKKIQFLRSLVSFCLFCTLDFKIS